MKISITLALLCLITTLCSAQSAILKMKDGNEYAVVIKATSNSSILVENTSVPYSEVSEATFEVKEQKYQSVYDRLAKNGIVISFSGTRETIIPEVVPEPEVKPGLQLLPKESITYTQTVNLETVLYAMERFHQQRTAGKVMQVLGTGVAVVTSILLVNGDKVDSTIPIVGAAITTIGLVLDIGASSNLKIRR